MEAYLMTIMKRASIFMILAQAIVHFRPSPAYEKYFKFLTGIMTLVILALPVMELLHSGISTQYEESLILYQQKLKEASGLEISEELSPCMSCQETQENKIKSKLNNYKQKELSDYEVKEVILMADAEEGEPLIQLLVSARSGDAKEIDIGKIVLERESSDKGTDRSAEEGRLEALQREAAEILGIEERQVEVKIVE